MLSSLQDTSDQCLTNTFRCFDAAARLKMLIVSSSIMITIVQAHVSMSAITLAFVLVNNTHLWFAGLRTHNQSGRCHPQGAAPRYCQLVEPPWRHTPGGQEVLIRHHHLPH